MDADTRLWASLWDAYREYRRQPQEREEAPTPSRWDGRPGGTEQIPAEG